MFFALFRQSGSGELVQFVWILALVLCCVAGCRRESGPPPPIALDQLPSLLQVGFAKASPDLKELVSQAVAALQVPDYTKAYQVLQSLSAAPRLSREQVSLAVRGMLTVHDALQAAQTKGDGNAAAALESYRIQK